jgi:hypothetical protein
MADFVSKALAKSTTIIRRALGKGPMKWAVFSSGSIAPPEPVVYFAYPLPPYDG